MRYEHLRVLLDDDDLWGMFVDMAGEFAQAAAPAEVMQALRLGRLTALNKKDDGVRGIVAGSVMRRLVCRAIAAQFSDEFLARTAPFQFALQTRAGPDAMGHALRAALEADPDAVLLSLSTG